MKFKSIKQVKEYLAEQLQQLRIDQSLIEQQINSSTRKLLANDLRLLDISGDSGPRPKRTIKIDFPVVDVPNKAALAKNYKLVELLTDRYKSAIAAENELKMSFKGAAGPVYMQLMGQFEKLKAGLEDNLRKLFEFLNKVAAGHAPKQYTKFVTAMAEELSSHLTFDSMRTMTYAATDEEHNLIFAGYIIMQNVITDEQKMAPHLYVIIKWTVGGGVEVYCDQDFTPPNQLHGGIEIANLRDAARAVKTELSLEGFSSTLGNLPASWYLKTKTEEELRKHFIDSSEFVKGVDVSGNDLVFKLTTGITTDQYKEVQAQIYALLREGMGIVKDRRKVKILNVPSSKDEMRFQIINLDMKHGVMPHDIEWLRDKYNVSEPNLRKIANLLNTR